jgi:hypothetical protein
MESIKYSFPLLNTKLDNAFYTHKTLYNAFYTHKTLSNDFYTHKTLSNDFHITKQSLDKVLLVLLCGNHLIKFCYVEIIR